MWGPLGKCSRCSGSVLAVVVELWRRVKLEFTIEASFRQPG